jgi:uncharacterized protein YceH (UPF0502 family)
VLSHTLDLERPRYGTGSVDADAVEMRVLGCLIEKQRTTPEAYPLSLNGLRLACNQSTNRDPVTDYDEQAIRAALDRLGRRGWTRFASGPGSRAPKYRHLLDEVLALDDADVSLLAVLMLRGPQTVGELRGRTERLHRFGSTAEVEEALRGLGGRELVARQQRRPGQKEERWAQLLGGGDSVAQVEPSTSPASPDRGSVEERLARLESQMESVLRALDLPSHSG